ncbi:hypothetical protein [Paraburkholderia hospita]|uniref:hypothetical protein n=1 Tax=Paraburkholderia hospita TaxID=169430 RepID=UPI0014050ACC|nr:hypothetical protein [Paraburkholderia hospita]
MPVRTILHVCAGRDDPFTEPPGVFPPTSSGRGWRDACSPIMDAHTSTRTTRCPLIYCFSADSPSRSTVGDPEKMALSAGESSAPVSTRTSAAEVSMLREAEDAQRRVGERGTVIMQGTAGTH